MEDAGNPMVRQRVRNAVFVSELLNVLLDRQVQRSSAQVVDMAALFTALLESLGASHIPPPLSEEAVARLDRQPASDALLSRMEQHNVEQERRVRAAESARAERAREQDGSGSGSSSNGGSNSGSSSIPPEDAYAALLGMMAPTSCSICQCPFRTLLEEGDAVDKEADQKEEEEEEGGENGRRERPTTERAVHTSTPCCEPKDAPVSAVPLLCRLPCNHVFCEPCLAEWLRRTSTCPNCRQELEDEYALEQQYRDLAAQRQPPLQATTANTLSAPVWWPAVSVKSHRPPTADTPGSRVTTRTEEVAVVTKPPDAAPPAPPSTAPPASRFDRERARTAAVAQPLLCNADAPSKQQQQHTSEDAIPTPHSKPDNNAVRDETPEAEETVAEETESDDIADTQLASSYDGNNSFFGTSAPSESSPTVAGAAAHTAPWHPQPDGEKAARLPRGARAGPASVGTKVPAREPLRPHTEPHDAVLCAPTLPPSALSAADDDQPQPQQHVIAAAATSSDDLFGSFSNYVLGEEASGCSSSSSEDVATLPETSSPVINSSDDDDAQHSDDEKDAQTLAQPKTESAGSVATVKATEAVRAPIEVDVVPPGALMKPHPPSTRISTGRATIPPPCDPATHAIADTEKDDTAAADDAAHANIASLAVDLCWM